MDTPESGTNLLVKLASKYQKEDFTDIHRFIRRRKIQRLFHFTHYSNLESIFNYGIKSKKYLKSNSIEYVDADKDRFDGFLEGISISISVPNTFLFSHKNILLNQQLVLLEISANILLTQTFIATPSNAAGPFAERIHLNPERYIGIKGLSGMFLNESLREQAKLEISEPTDQQAELLFFDDIEPSKIQRVHVGKNFSEEERVILLETSKRHSDFPFDIPCNCGYFQRWTGVFRKWDVSWEEDGK